MDEITALAKNKIPFVFVLSYDKSRCIIERVDNLQQIQFNISTKKSFTTRRLRAKPVSFERYSDAFYKVMEQIKKGNTYLLNLTFPAKIEQKLDLEQVFYCADAKYKVLVKDKFVSFSPETFVKIKDNKIFAFPMKGTIDATIKDAKKQILDDEKEKAEHTMIVDLLRNDLGIIGQKVRVERFRYVEDIGGLLQVSSQISAELSGWQSRLGEIIDAITPAGSITGTPKKKTMQIIADVEGYKRGFFSGIFGYFDGESFDSCVLIRYIEKEGKDLIYKSGGGITIDSDAKKEYQEMIKKIYISKEEDVY